jgi:hypothetical protein
MRVALSFALYLVACEVFEYFLIRRRAEVVFPPKLGWRLLRLTAIAWCIAGIWGRLHGSATGPGGWPLWLYVVLLFFWIFWPRTVVVDSSTVSSCSLFGFGRRSILWNDASRVSSDWEETRLAWNLFTVLWTFMGTSVTVTGRSGASVQHGVINRAQGLFLDALRRYLPREAFDAGLYDWRP